MPYDTQALKQQARDHLWMAYQPPTPFETIHPGNVIFFSPPPIISREEVDQLIGIVDRALTCYEETN